MTSSMVVPVIDVQNDNFKELWPTMVMAIKTCSFVAVDTELSGLGNRKALLAESIEDRYKAICHAARTRSILSLGIACYQKVENKGENSYLVQVYNLTLLCSEEYTIEPQSVQFLVQHGFDFNKQYAQGIPYCKGNNKAGSDNQGVSMRALFTELLRARKPLVLHNGLIDMAFLYQCFYAHLPERLTNFTADLSEMFPAGVYDTKYATEFELRLTASYLEYAYKKCKLDNNRLASGGSGPHVHVDFCQYAGQMSSYVDYRACPATAFQEGQADSVCQRFSAFGWCPNGSQCPLSHDTDLIILQDEKSQEDKRSKNQRRRDKKRDKKRARAGQEKDALISLEGAPENKISRMEVNPHGAPEHHQGTTAQPCPESEPLPMPQQAACPPIRAGALPEAVRVKREGNGVCEGKVAASAFEGAPENKVSCMELEPEGAPAPRHGAPGEPCPKSKPLVGQQQADRPAVTAGALPVAVCVKTEHEGNGVCGDNATEAKSKKMETGTHRAGFDAFMTGYIFAYAASLAKKTGREEEGLLLPECFNKVYLSGKSAPLHIVKSSFSKSSKAHIQKMEAVWGKSVASTLVTM